MTILKKLNRIFGTSAKVKLFFLLVAIIIGGLMEMVVLALVAPFIEVLLDNTIIQTNPYLNRLYNFLNLSDTTTLLGVLALVLAFAYIFRGVYLYIINRASIRFVNYRQGVISKMLLDKILDFSYLYHTHKNISEIQRIISNDVAQLFAMIMGFLHFLADFFMTLFILALLFYQSPLMTACVLGLSLICIVIYFLVFQKRIRTAGINNREAYIDMSKAVYQTFGGIKEIKVSQKDNFFRKVFKDARNRMVKTLTRYQTINLVPKYAIEMICFGGAFIALSLSIFLGTDISALVPQLSLFVLAAFRLLPAISRSANEFNSILYNRASVDAVYKSLFEEKDIASLPVSLSAPASKQDTDSSTTADIEVCDVSFKYPGIEEAVLTNVSLTIPENKSVAFIGPSGAGKTTLADIILGVITPDTGTILYKGLPIYDNPVWSKSVGYIPQQIYLLDESILENVAFGVDKEDVDEQKAWRALEQAQLKEFVEGLPDGIHTIVGDRGIRLSGGQRQRVGIARAMYEDPPILVLDEATSSLDNETEKAVMEAIIGFQGAKTMLIVAHRLSTIEHCDIVYKVEDKTVIRER